MIIILDPRESIVNTARLRVTGFFKARLGFRVRLTLLVIKVNKKLALVNNES